MGSAGQCVARSKKLLAAVISEKKLNNLNLSLAIQIFTKNLEKLKNTIKVDPP